ncbi:MAG TPA: NAD(P)H-dependent oxidoreductase subunit E [Sedimentisphaerales bacterium]|nr:NAD(P)H-dependent oxidoreductase subunit E [Sedimentisphaerales bacterium]HRS11550.1 NAD(P)H-dependent oxidoreductase subunit E [Sedimentisphaerales bacterium]HRV48198.1 NAD(P)H-dependent oxidoreductase subunit E [Sedimentisphaerales bacterium]
MEELDLKFVDQTVARVGTGAEKVLEILQALQTYYGYLPTEALQRVCALTEITPATITGVSTFYDQFRHRPAGKHIIHVCVGTACHVKGADQVYEEFLRYLGIPEGEDTDAQKLFTVEKIACLGCCTLAPAVQIDDVTYGHLTRETVPKVLSDFLRHADAKAARHGKRRRKGKAGAVGELRVGLGSCCVARGSGRLNEALDRALAETGVKVSVKRVGCVGMCHQTPLLEVVLPNGESSLYARVQPEDAKAIVLRHFGTRGPVRKVRTKVSRVLDRLLTDENSEPVTRYSIHVRDRAVSDFLGHQIHIATEHCGQIDPTDLDEYLAHDGFQALEKSLREFGPEEVIAQIEKSGLRGRGGAGFPTHLKWSAVRAQEAEIKYIVCNGDEGDPGAFMDRMLMESYPYRILEGMAIAARCVGAKEGFLYIRAEYPLAIRRVNEAIEKCADRGYLGDHILGSDFSLRLKIVAGAGAFVCGEETALMASIEGRRGMPRLRPPYPAVKGLWSRPTLINNVETYAAVPWILRNGADAYAAIGTDKSKGTKVFALAGKVARGGLIEVPMGISIRQIVEEIGGGVAGGLKFKAVQVGGPSGGCIPVGSDNLSIDYESLTAAGAMMGSGGLVVLDETDCMVDIARYFLQFTQNQSCGKCTFCRIGTRRMLDILDRLCAGEGRVDDLDELQHLAEMVKKGSLCGLGKTAPNPVLSTLRYFRDEYEAHIRKRCPAGKCKALIAYSITDDCIGCTICVQHCPTGAIEMKPYEKHEIDPNKCVRCGTCKSVCPAAAIRVE